MDDNLWLVGVKDVNGSDEFLVNAHGEENAAQNAEADALADGFDEATFEILYVEIV
jgi:hypothetical protein